MSHIKTIKQSTINRALLLHQEWLETQGRKGKRLVVTNHIVKHIDFSVINDFSYADFSYADFSKLNLMRVDLSELNFIKAKFSNAIFSRARFYECNFDDCIF